MGNIEMISLIIDFASQIIRKQEFLSCPFILWLDGQVSLLLEESEGFHDQFAKQDSEHRGSRRVAVFSL
jgi:hypothetical protein